ncbi:MAG: hypothetical protein ACN4GW_13110 [Desulforhopalus sp.]
MELEIFLIFPRKLFSALLNQFKFFWPRIYRIPGTEGWGGVRAVPRNPIHP